MSTRPILRYANACLAAAVTFAALLCAAAATPASAAVVNLLVNPGFEGATGGSLAGAGSSSGFSMACTRSLSPSWATALNGWRTVVSGGVT